MGALTSFFSSAGKAEEGIAHAKELQENPPVEDSRNDYEIVIEMMVAERQLKQFNKDLKEMFIYQFQEPGLYDEFMGRLEKLRADRRQRETDHKLHLKALEMAARRQRARAGSIYTRYVCYITRCHSFYINNIRYCLDVHFGGLMLTLLSTFTSFLMGGLLKILDFFQDKSDKKHELELAKMQTERELS